MSHFKITLLFILAVDLWLNIYLKSVSKVLETTKDKRHYMAVKGESIILTH